MGFHGNKGDIIGFIGPNGAGKTTTMRLLTGVMNPSSGSILYHGNDIHQNICDFQSKIGYLPEGAPLYEELSPQRFLSQIADIHQIKKEDKDHRLGFLYHYLQLKEMMHRPIHTLSKGYKRRVALAGCLLHDPDILILDEPTDGLDPNQKHLVRKLLMEIAQNKLIIISTHILDEVDAICNRVVLVNHGRVIEDTTPHLLGHSLKAKKSNHTLLAQIHFDIKNAIQKPDNKSKIIEKIQAQLHHIDGISMVQQTSMNDDIIIAFDCAITAENDTKDNNKKTEKSTYCNTKFIKKVQKITADLMIDIHKLHIGKAPLDHIFYYLTNPTDKKKN